MSAIAGILKRKNSGNKCVEVMRMLDSMDHRYEKRGIDSLGLVDFGYGSFPSTREELPITKPYIFGNMALVCDGRLDNRDELGRAFNWDNSRTRNASDHEIILTAYKRWDLDCLSRLIGVFSFALWDGNHLFCARDRFGVKPFTYILEDEFFAFASESKAILTLPEVKEKINEEQICLHFYPQLLTYEQKETYFKNIYRLPPAHAMIITREKAEIFSYWNINQDNKTVYRDEREYYEGFKEILNRAVSDRLRSYKPVGTALSGGLDSSSITCLARDIYNKRAGGPLEVFSCVFDEATGSDESEWIRSVELQGGLSPNHVHADTTPPMKDIEDLIHLHEGPFYGANAYLQKSLYGAARKKGVNVFLDGEDGDSVVSHGYDYLSLLAHRADWNKFFDEADGIVRNFDDPQVFFSHSYLFRRYGLPYLIWLQKSGRWFSYLKNIHLIHKKIGISRKSFFKALIYESNKKDIAYSDSEPINQEMWEKYQIGKRLKEMKVLPSGRQLSMENWYHYDGIVNSGYAYSLEFADRLAAWYGMEVRHPFFDHRLAEYCVSLPASIKLRGGYTRFYFREAMKGILPDKVRLRGGKGDLTHSAVRGYRLYHDTELIENVRMIGKGDSVANWRHAEKVMEKYMNNEDDSQTLPLWNLSTYGLWKKNH